MLMFPKRLLAMICAFVFLAASGCGYRQKASVAEDLGLIDKDQKEGIETLLRADEYSDAGIPGYYDDMGWHKPSQTEVQRLLAQIKSAGKSASRPSSVPFSKPAAASGPP